MEAARPKAAQGLFPDSPKVAERQGKSNHENQVPAYSRTVWRNFATEMGLER